MSEDDLTPEEIEELGNLLGGGSPSKKDKKDIFEFFSKILKTGDTIKVSNLDINTELAPVRILRSTAEYAKIMGLDEIKDFLHAEAEVILGSALSKNGFLVDMAVTTKKESKIGTKEKGGNKGWFKKKEEV